MSNVANNAHLRVVVFGRARVERGGKAVELRRKGLALLAYLGMTGPTSRDQVAGLLWEQWTGRANLRVELHRLTEDVGVILFASGADPLSLPDWVEVAGAPSDGALLDGLDGISPAYDAWLESQRTRVGRLGPGNNHAAMIAARLASELKPPFLVVVRARPMDDMESFTSPLGDALHLPVVRGVGGPAKAVHVLTPPYGPEFQSDVLGMQHGVPVVRVPSYGEDPVPVLQLRNAYDPSRTRFVEMPSMSWADARAGVVHELAFPQAAEAYLWSGGSASFLRELASMGWAREDDGRLALPQRVRAAYQLEARHASIGARLALERLSVHPGRLSDALVDHLGGRDAVDELERRGWLLYDGAWRFRDPTARLVVYRSLQSGRRAAYHRAAAEGLAQEGRWLASTFHRLAAGDPADLSDSETVASGLTSDAARVWLGLDLEGDAPAAVETAPGEELALLEHGRQGPGLEGDGADWQVVRWGDRSPSWVAFDPSDTAQALHVTGRAWVDPALGLGVDGDATPLELEVGWGHRVAFLSGLREPVVHGGELLLPLSSPLDVWLLVPRQRELRLVSRAFHAVIELQLTAHEWRGVNGAGGRNGLVKAFNLGPGVVVGSERDMRGA